MADRIITGYIDEFGFMCIDLNIINPETRYTTKKVKAIIDTGAYSTHIKQSVIDSIGLEVKTQKSVLRPISGKETTNVYDVLLKLDDKYSIPDIEVMVLTEETYPAEIILGMNLIKHCDLNYSTHDKKFELNVLPVVSPEQ